MLYSRLNFLDTLATLTESERRQFFRTLIRKLFRTLGLIIALGMIWMIWAAMLSRGLTNRNALESAQAARHLVQGDGFTTSVIRPLSFHFFPVLEDHPDLTTPPLMTILMSVLFVFAGATDRMVILASGLGWIACALLIYFIARDLSGRRGVGFYALGLWCVNVAAGQYAVDGDNVSWAAALFTATIWFLHRAGERAGVARLEQWTRAIAIREMPYGWALLSGFTASLFTLCEPLLALCVWLPLLWFWLRWPSHARLPTYVQVADNSIKWRERNIFLGGYRRRLLLYVMAPAVALPGLWYAYGYVRSWPHAPGVLRSFWVNTFSSAYPGESIFRYATPPVDMPLIFWLGQIREAFRDSVEALLPLPEAMIYLAGFVPLAFFVAGLFMGLDGRVRSFRRRLAAPFVLSLLLLSLWSMNARYFAIFLPGILIVGVLVMHHVLANRWRVDIPVADSPSMRQWILALIRRFWWLTRRHQVYALFLIVAAIPAVMLRLNLPPKTALRAPPGLDHLMNHSALTDVVLTDDPWLVAWYGQRTAVWLPQRERDVTTMMEQGARFDWVYVNNARVTDPREIGDWWPQLVGDKAGWRDFRVIEKNFPRERVMQRMPN